MPDPPAAQVDLLGINFRRMTHTIYAGYIEPRMTEITESYAALRETLSEIVATELAVVRPPLRPAAAAGPLQDRGLIAWLGRRVRRAGAEAKREPPSEREERELEAWRAEVATSEDPARIAACRALIRLALAIRSRHGRWWGDQQLLGSIAVGLACNEYGSQAIGRLIEPWIGEACRREGYARLARQERPVIMNVKGASASGKSTMRQLQKQMAAELGLRWSDFALISPDIWRKYLLDYASLGEDYKYAGALAGHELAIIDQKLDRYMARKAVEGAIPHLLIDRFRFDSFAPDSDEAGSNLLTRFGQSIYMLFMITPPHETVVRAWKRGLEVGRYKTVDDLLAHNVEAYAGMPGLFFTWALHPGKSVHYEFLDNCVPPGERPKTVAFGWHGEMNILDVKGIIDIDRFRKIDVDASTPIDVYRDAATMLPENNTDFMCQCVRKIAAVNFADRDTGRIYARFESGRPVRTDPGLLARALEDEETRTGLCAVAPGIERRISPGGPLRKLRPDRFRTVGRWGERPNRLQKANGSIDPK
ncbi:MAG: hypothetical protein ACREFO_09840 [Acetobacteraceae bacterium]